MTRFQVIGLVVGFAVIGGAAGALAGPAWIAGGGLVGFGAGVVAVLSAMRPLVALAILLGSLGGALVGRGVVRALCLPGSCPALEVVAAVLTGIGALVGVGLVVALVTRSFDEYRETLAGARPDEADEAAGGEAP